ncbi:putative thiamine-phosphate pyrophosphorylase [Sphingomonas changbaiensis NBRC 104936]|uniref:Putative thiamine-phosphate pyrophosphorylase n=1 Tax=Sphingomonas changbaiensis NBRC 104936 TaxID=1219043 RepID=A0A0E9MRD0_9SPHN|nr:thiamine phosphate synthase [Sphingomonas changbaiensis]GAO40104.1 putative thiamine-phosphate pyrophosphorylase [Sphingomonas changbaiensis NBRC 104936]
MNRRHLALPRVWILTDERQGEALWNALARLPKSAGVIVRHYSLPLAERLDMARRIREQRRFVAFAGTEKEARQAGAQAIYGAGPRTGLPRLYPVHNHREIRAAERAGAALLLLSPVFPTRSHPGARTLGPHRVARLAASARAPIIALGGMTSVRFRRLERLGALGWAAIDAWIAFHT